MTQETVALESAYKKYGLLGSTFYIRLAAPLAGIFVRVGITPNAVTISSFVIFVAGILLLIRVDVVSLIVGTLLLHLGNTLDYADGLVARATGKMSFLGAWLDNSLDRAGEFLLLLPFAMNLVGTARTDDGFAPLLAVSSIFVVLYASYIFDIGYFHRAAIGGSASLDEWPQTLWRQIVVLWSRATTRDTTIAVLNVGLVTKSYLWPVLAVFIMAILNILVFTVREVVLHRRSACNA